MTTRATPRADRPGPGDIIDLSALVQTRVSPEAKAIIRKRATAAGQREATFVRGMLYRALGLTKE